MLLNTRQARLAGGQCHIATVRPGFTKDLDPEHADPVLAAAHAEQVEPHVETAPLGGSRRARHRSLLEWPMVNLAVLAALRRSAQAGCWSAVARAG